MHRPECLTLIIITGIRKTSTSTNNANKQCHLAKITVMKTLDEIFIEDNQQKNY